MPSVPLPFPAPCDWLHGERLAMHGLGRVRALRMGPGAVGSEGAEHGEKTSRTLTSLAFKPTVRDKGQEK